MLTPSQRDALLALARDSISAALDLGPPVDALPDDGPLADPGSAFVTLRFRGRLRGCIGMIGHNRSLAAAVRDAAQRVLLDPRFKPVKAKELPELSIEISVLTPFEEIDDPAEVVPGRHGLMISRAGRAGLLLPQVATEQGWGRDHFLDQTCVKAGLDPDAWRDPDTRIEVFEADVF